jgi:hypothetical protein
VSKFTSKAEPIGEQLAAVFRPALEPLGFGSPEVSEDTVLFDGAQVRFQAAYVPRDGELAVYVIPHGTAEHLQLMMYLRAIGSPAVADLGEVVAESAEAALRHALIYAAAIPDAALLLAGDPAELARARSLRWWDVSQHVSPDRQVLRFQTTAKASADAHALARVGLARIDLIVDTAALVLALILLVTGNVVLGMVVASLAGLSLIDSRFHALQRFLIGMRYRSLLGTTTEVTIADDGLRFESPLGSTFFPWSSITRVRSNSKTVAFFRDRVLLGYIPSSAFDSQAAQANVARFAQTRVAIIL